MYINVWNLNFGDYKNNEWFAWINLTVVLQESYTSWDVDRSIRQCKVL